MFSGIIRIVTDQRIIQPTDALISDDALLHRIQSGDKLACAVCIERYAPGVYRLALRLMKNEADAEDVVQETFLNAFKAITSFEGRSELRTWLYRIAHNPALTRLRGSAPLASSVEETLEMGEGGFAVPHQFFDWCCLPEQEFETEELQAELEQAIQQLSPALRAVFVLRELEGLSTQETAESLNTTPNVVKTRLHRARLQLRELLSDYFSRQVQVGEKSRYGK